MLRRRAAPASRSGGDGQIGIANELLVFEGKELLKYPLRRRCALLEAKVPFPITSLLRLAPRLPGSPGEILPEIRKLGLEGVVAKDLDSIYIPGEETGSWLKQRADE